MMRPKPERALGIGVAVGFAAVLLLMGALTGVGLFRIHDIDRQLTQIATQHNIKTAAVNEMLLTLRDRAISMHTIATLSDPFDREDEHLIFTELGARYRLARERLESLPLSVEEQAILARIRTLTITAQPFTEQAIRDALSGEGATALAARNRAIPAQKNIALELDRFLILQQTQVEGLLAQAARSHANTRSLILFLSLSAGLISFGIAGFVIRSATRQAQLLRHQALFDGLTGLPNRTLFSDRLHQATLIARREKQTFALVTMDLDRFKEINDTLGHPVGDELLIAVAKRIRLGLRESDTVARMGGDEFNILLPTVGNIDGAVAAVKKLIDLVMMPLPLQGKSVQIAASFGIAMFPEHATDSDDLMRHADTAMYAAKRAQTGVHTYSAELGRTTDNSVTLNAELRGALANDELLLHYQPKIDLQNNVVGGVEALVRWQHPQKGLLYPDTFITLAENTGLIKTLTVVVLKKALQQCQLWRAAGMEIPIAVNISAANIQDIEFPEMVATLLRAFDVPASLLELEVTETAVMTKPAQAVECIKKLSALGLQVSIDDFGTGYSSMTYLKDLLVAKIKIDKSFVMDMSSNHSDAVIVRSTVELGHNLGLKVVAEGVESEEVWQKLIELGCDTAQGYYMSRPITAAKFEQWLRESPWGLRKPVSIKKA